MASEQPVSLRGAVGMEFELKVDGNPADAMYPLIYPFGNHVQAREPYPQPTGEWKNDRLLFESQPPERSGTIPDRPLRQTGKTDLSGT